MAANLPVTPPLRIIIVGAGLGGLAAAVSLRRQGHKVEILESSLMNKEIGAAIYVQPNAMRVLEYFGYEKENLQGVEAFGLRRFSSVGGDALANSFTNEGNLASVTSGRRSEMCLRADLHNELKRLAIGNAGAGPPAQLHLGQEVIKCDPDEGSLTMKNGQVHEADLVIGADGIHSIIRTAVLGYEQKALSTGTSTYRCLFNAEKLEGLSDMEWFTQGPPGARIVNSSEERFHMIFLSSCRRGKVVNVVAHYSDDRDQDKHAWSEIATVEEVLEEFKHFHPRYLNFLELGEQPILRWQLRALPLLPTWVNGCTALLGDAAHATLPTLGQGAGMALEDAATIGCLLPKGTKKEDIPARLKAYQTLRKPRGELVNRGSVEAVTAATQRGRYGGVNDHLRSELVGYDAVGVTQKYLREHFETVA